MDHTIQTAMVAVVSLFAGGGGVFALIKFQTKSFLAVIEKDRELITANIKDLTDSIKMLTHSVQLAVQNQVSYIETTRAGFQHIGDRIDGLKKER